jgi:hypothetical protein
MKIFRCFFLAAFFAALFVLVDTADADCPDEDPRCTILPPISREIGGTTHPDTLDAGLAETSSLVPLEHVIPVPPPPVAEFVIQVNDPIPLGLGAAIL